MSQIRFTVGLASAALLVTVAAAGAEPISVPASPYAGGAEHFVVSAHSPARECMITYSDISNASGYGFAPPSLDATVMDDLHMTSGGWLCSFDVGYNNGTSAPVDVTVTFYETDDEDAPPTAVVGGPFLLEDMPTGVNIVHVEVEPGVAELPAHVWMAVSFSLSNVTLLIYDPPTVGTSHDWFYLIPPGGYYWFGGSPTANFCMQVECDVSSGVDSSATWGTIKALYR